MKNALLQGRAVTKVFCRGSAENRVLDRIDVDIYAEDFTVVMGSSGAGKSTLLYALSGMDRITDGRVLYKGREISSLKETQMARLRAKEFGFVFQQTHLVSSLTLLENITVSGYVAGKEKPEKVREHAGKLLSQMEIEKVQHRMPFQVSGGEAQRAAVARAVIGMPGILFADEPTGALNRANSAEVLDLFTELNRSGQSILMVTHDIRSAVRGNRILYLEDGRVIDELVLSSYNELEEKQREDKISEWLSALQW